jgi:hypothetical protein
MAKNNGMMRMLKEYWFLVMAAVTVIGLGWQLIAVDRDFRKHQELVGHPKAMERISSIETNIEWIKESNKRIELKLDRIGQ